MSIIDPPGDAAAGAGGMEYPTLVTTGGDVAIMPDGVHLPELVTVHEVGHNWFQGLLASNEVDEAWLDEGMNDYADGLVMNALYGEQTSAIDWADLYSNYFALSWELAGGGQPIPDPIAQSSYRFVDIAAYVASNYSTPATIMRTLEKVVGSEKFLAALRAYAEKYAFTHPREADLRDTLERELGQDLDWFLQPALHQAGATPDLRVRTIRCRTKRPPRGVFGRGGERKLVEPEGPADAPQSCDVVVENLGQVPVPVDVAITFADGKSVRKRWDDRGRGPRWVRFELENSEPIVEVVIDPDGRVPFDRGGVRRGMRVTQEAEPSLRAAVQGQFWTQTLMQVLGL
jgi:Peptidase family M1 domain